MQSRSATFRSRRLFVDDLLVFFTHSPGKTADLRESWFKYLQILSDTVNQIRTDTLLCQHVDFSSQQFREFSLNPYYTQKAFLLRKPGHEVKITVSTSLATGV